MKIAWTLLLGLAFILNFIELSSQSQRPAETNVRIRSRSSNLERTFPGVLGFSFEDLGLIRLRPYNSLNRVYELQKYIFPPDKPIGLKSRKVQLNPMPTGEQIVLSTSNGDAYAILDKTGCRTIILRALCVSVSGQTRRVKINMNSGAVKELTEEEIEECPVTVKVAISKIYKVSSSHPEVSPDINSDPSSHQCEPSSSATLSPPAESTLLDRSRSPTLRQTFNTVFGYQFDDLKYIRLIPKKYPHRRFKLRGYTFPQDKPIGMMTLNRVLHPMPNGDQIVLSTSNGDVCAVLEKTQWRNMLVRPIFTSNLGVLERVKINMNTGVVEKMTTEEIAECPGTSKVAVRTCYKVVHL